MNGGNYKSSASRSSKKTRTIAGIGAVASLAGSMFALFKMGMAPADGSLTGLMVIFVSLLFVFSVFIVVAYQINFGEFFLGAFILIAAIAFGFIWEKRSDWGGSVLAMVLFIAMLAISLAIYFLPSYIAMKRSHKNLIAIFALNLLTGWSFFGWVIALVWALKND